MTYTTQGPVRGSCGHSHRSVRTAAACAERDHRVCRSLGGGAYSDRVVVRLYDGGGVEVIDGLELEGR